MIASANLKRATELMAELRAAEALSRALTQGARVNLSVVERDGRHHAVAADQAVMVPKIAADVAARVAEIRQALTDMGVEP